MSVDGPFLARFGKLAALVSEDIAATGDAFTKTIDAVSQQKIVEEGDRPRRLHVVVSGLAARMKLMRSGQRHLCTLLVPGDVCDIDGFHVRQYDYGVIALTRTTLATAERATMLALCAARPNVARGLTWLGYVDNAMLNEAAASLARRPAPERIAHLLCELWERIAAVGLAEPDGFALPLSQADVADVLGLTPVHVNRTLRDLHRAGIATFVNRKVVVHDWAELRELADFRAGYLHLDGMRPLPA